MSWPSCQMYQNSHCWFSASQLNLKHPKQTALRLHNLTVLQALYFQIIIFVIRLSVMPFIHSSQKIKQKQLYCRKWLSTKYSVPCLQACLLKHKNLKSLITPTWNLARNHVIHVYKVIQLPCNYICQQLFLWASGLIQLFMQSKTLLSPGKDF